MTVGAQSKPVGAQRSSLDLQDRPAGRQTKGEAGNKEIKAKHSKRGSDPTREKDEEEGASERSMGFLFRVRFSSFFAGAAVASVGGFYYLYKDYMLAQRAISQQVKDGYDSLEGRYEALSARIAALESSKNAESAPPVVESAE